MSLKITINVDEIVGQLQEFKEEIAKDISLEIGRVAAQAKGYIEDQAKSKLKSSRDIFLRNLTYEEVSPGIHMITVLDEGIFVEEGFASPFDMKPGLLNSDKAKTGENGFRYLSVPFQHNKAPSSMTPKSLDIRDRLLKNLARENKQRKGRGESKVPWMKPLELNSDGSPKMGRLHTFNWGGEYPTPQAKTKDLERVSVYQSLDKGTGKVRRDFFTFRTVTDNPEYKDKWIHPPQEGKKFLEDAEQWFINKWENEALPAVLKKWGVK